MPKKSTKTEEKASGFAVIKTGGKQYKVSVGGSYNIEKIKGEYKEGDKLTFNEVLLKSDGADVKIGDPLVSGAKVEGVLEKIGRNKKVMIIKYKAKSNRLKKNGHRQPFFRVKISSI